MARAEAPAPEAYADDYAELKAAFELAKKSEESTKLIAIYNRYKSIINIKRSYFRDIDIGTSI